MKQKQNHRHRVLIGGCQGEGAWERDGVGGIVRELEIDLYTLVYLKWITNKNLLYRQGTLLNIM